MVLALLVAVAATSPKAAIATPHPLASEVGAAVLRSGGNAVDAAIASAFALSVVGQQSSGLGGGGFALVYDAHEGKVHAFDFRELAPLKATPDMYLENGKAREDLAAAGSLSVAVPAAVRGYTELARRFGRKPLSQLTGPAELLASRGFAVGLVHARAVEARLDCLEGDPEATRIYLHKDRDGELVGPAPGDKLVQPDLARTLHAIGLHGADAFYKGAVARSIVETLRGRGGILTLEDFAQVKLREREPIASTYRGYRVVTMPPPSSGGFLLLALLNVLEREEPRAGGYRPEKFLHVMAETEKRLFARRQKMGDPAFNPKVDANVREMISKDYAGTLRSEIGEKATPSESLVPPADHLHTSNISVIDAEGNAVALTTTVNDTFGSCVVAKGTGVVLNDQMDDFAVAPGVANVYGLMGDAENAPGPGKVPLSSMSPTLMFDPDGELVLSIGSAGGATIPTSVAQAILHIVDDHMPIDRAIAAPRIHHNLFPDVIHVEPDALEAQTAHALEARGHKLDFATEGTGPGGFFTHLWGNTTGVMADPETGWKSAAGDPRREGTGAVP
jgi:gamma-glutamyltranspeptidase/glutathione hydrolase